MPAAATLAALLLWPPFAGAALAADPPPPARSPAPSEATAGAPAPAAAEAPPPEAAHLPAFAPHASGFPFAYPGARLEAAAFADLPGWAEDRHDLALKAFQVSCRPILQSSAPPRVAAQVWHALRAICPRALALPVPAERQAARTFFEAEFAPARLAADEEEDGFVTAYYEPEIPAARERSEAFSAPFLAKPDDLTSARGPGAGFDARSGAGRWVNGRFLPYYDRREIETGALEGRGLEIAWARDATDVLFTQIQGSARLRFADGTTLRIGYAAHNGYRYVPVGRVLLERGLARRDEITMDFIRSWMARNPEAAAELRWQNRSYVFFRVKTELGPDDGPVGGQGVPLTDWRSLAVDRNVHAYGTPVYVAGFLPTGMAGSGEPFRRLMIAQDTGSAILGPARGDLFLGSGPEAGSTAGRIRHRIAWHVLLPRALAPQSAAVPVPVPRPPRRGR